MNVIELRTSLHRARHNLEAELSRCDGAGAPLTVSRAAAGLQCSTCSCFDYAVLCSKPKLLEQSCVRYSDAMAANCRAAHALWQVYLQLCHLAVAVPASKAEACCSCPACATINNSLIHYVCFTPVPAGLLLVAPGMLSCWLSCAAWSSRLQRSCVWWSQKPSGSA
jgi:hypothetical protein